MTATAGLKFDVREENGQEYLFIKKLSKYGRSYYSNENTNQLYDSLIKKLFISSKESNLDLADFEPINFQENAFDEMKNGGDGAGHGRNDNEFGTDMVSELYQRLRQAHFEYDKLSTNDVMVQHPAMKATLKSYQVGAVRWMLHRELCHEEDSMYQRVYRRWPPNDDDDSDGNQFFYNPFQWTLRLKPEVSKIQLPSGGILADEMGLGKTVEALALILLNQRPIEEVMGGSTQRQSVEYLEIDDDDDDNDDDEDDDEYGDDEPQTAKRWKPMEVPVRCFCRDTSNAASKRVIQCSKCRLRQHRACVLKHAVADIHESNYICPQCWNYEEPVKSGGTVIVSPRSIKKQWFHEVKKHIDDDNFKVCRNTLRRCLLRRELSNGSFICVVIAE